MNFLETVQKARRMCGIVGTGPTTLVSQTGIYQKLAEWVADADVMIQGQWVNWDFLRTTNTFNLSADVRDYTLASLNITDHNMWAVDSFIRDSTAPTYQVLTHLPYHEWYMLYKNGTQTTGTPTHFTVKPTRALAFYPIPDATYAVDADYFRSPQRMSANTDTSLIPSQYHDILVYRAKMLYAESEDAQEVYQLASADYARVLAQLEAHSLPNAEHATGLSTTNLVVRVE